MFKESGITIPQTIVSADRYSWVDVARGIAIILVVYRHVVVGLMRADISISHYAFDFQEIFYNFRMPLFFILSGVFVARSMVKKTPSMILKDRAASILYPYLLWGAIIITLQIIFSKYTNSSRSAHDYFFLFTQPRKVDHLWYLLALFNTSVLYLLLNQFTQRKVIHIIVGTALHALTITSVMEGNSLIADICYFYIYFICGVVFSEALLDRRLQTDVMKFRTLAILLPLFLIGQWFWYIRMDEESTYLPLFFFINLIGCAVIYAIAVFLSRFNSAHWLSYIGEHSLYIYIMHVPIAAMVRSVFMRIGTDINGPLILVLCWVSGIGIPIIIYQTLREYGFKKMFSLKPSRTT